MSDPTKTPRPNLERLLQTGAVAAQSGNRPAARALFHALTREYPDDERVWLGLAAVAATPAAQIAALQQALSLNPANHQAREALARLEAQTPSVSTPAAATQSAPPPAEAHPAPVVPASDSVVALDPLEVDDEPPQRSPFPLLNLLALLLILLLLGGLGIFIGQQLLAQARPQVTPTPGLVVQPTGIAPTLEPVVVVPPPTVAPASPVASPAPTIPATSELPAPTALAATQPSPPLPSPTPSTELPLGAIFDYDGWSATLLRPDYAVALDGAIGDLQPNGQFVLAVVAITNNSPQARAIPADLFTLSDDQRRSYSPVPGASSVYLAIYERGQRGDLALEDRLEPTSGMRSVPLIFDVAPDATGLRLHMPGTGVAGWPISGGAPAPVGP
ncbi:MAG: hypothetical protein AB4911_13485 [Oscillochloridaceae bacterium umkhey_bin13]